jgi:hypothetical protein
MINMMNEEMSISDDKSDVKNNLFEDIRDMINENILNLKNLPQNEDEEFERHLFDLL